METTIAKVCTKCGVNRPIYDYEPSYDKRSDGYSKYRSECRPCRNAYKRANYKKYPDKFKALSLKFRLNNPDKLKNTDLFGRFGIGLDEYNLILKRQNGVCAICNQFKLRKDCKYMPVDHCHTTGKVRAILCHTCNSGIGHFFDNPDLMRSAVQYLERTNGIKP